MNENVERKYKSRCYQENVELDSIYIEIFSLMNQNVERKYKSHYY
jgi:hypothetical protein